MRVNRVQGMNNVSIALWFALLLQTYDKCLPKDTFGEDDICFEINGLTLFPFKIIIC